MVTDGILTDVLIEDTQDSTKLSRHSENAVENNMVLCCQASVQAAMKDEYKIFNVSSTKKVGCWHWPGVRVGSLNVNCLSTKTWNKANYHYICNRYEIFLPLGLIRIKRGWKGFPWFIEEGFKLLPALNLYHSTLLKNRCFKKTHTFDMFTF